MNTQTVTNSVNIQPIPIQNGGGFIGQSRVMQDFLGQATRVANTDCRVLLMGESEMETESLARAIHEKSHRHHSPFLKINCSPGTPQTPGGHGIDLRQFTNGLSISVLFEGIDSIDGGTLYLDDVGDLSAEDQTTLLGLLIHLDTSRHDSADSFSCDLRIIAATRRNLYEDVKENRYRRDLFYRLNVLPLRIPPLRERKDDLPSLIQHFLAKYSRKHRKPEKFLSQSAMLKLCQYSWPGNIRELKATLERAVIFSKGEVLDERFMKPVGLTCSLDELMTTLLLQDDSTFAHDWEPNRVLLHT